MISWSWTRSRNNKRQKVDCDGLFNGSALLAKLPRCLPVHPSVLFNQLTAMRQRQPSLKWSPLPCHKSYYSNELSLWMLSTTAQPHTFFLSNVTSKWDSIHVAIHRTPWGQKWGSPKIILHKRPIFHFSNQKKKQLLWRYVTALTVRS